MCKSGVFWDKTYSKWCTVVRWEDFELKCGLFDSEEEAAKRYDAVAKELHERPILNWLGNGELNHDRKKLGRPEDIRYENFLSHCL